MKKIFVFAAIIFILVLMLAIWFFLINLGNLAHILGNEGREIAIEEHNRFLGTWNVIGSSRHYTFQSDGSYLIDSEPFGTWVVDNNSIILNYNRINQVKYTYSFSQDETLLTLIDKNNDTLLLKRQ